MTSLHRQQQPEQQQQPRSRPVHEQRQQPQQRQPWALLGALSVSLYQSLSFSRSPSFERTRYIASTCTFIAIIYLRTLHCLFFGTGALSCAVLAHCLKHIIRQPRPVRVDLTVEEDMDTSATTVHSQSVSTPSSSNSVTSVPAKSTVEVISPSERTSTITKESQTDPIPRAGSPTISLAPTTTLQREQVNASNEPKARIASQRIRRQRRRKLYLRVDYGMPSSHAQLVAFFVCYISLQLVLMEPEGSAGQWFLILLLQLYAWSVVWSRIQLGQHSVSQVLVGAAVGAAYGIMWFAIWSWKVEDMIQHWQWMDRYGVIQVRKMWKQLELDEAAVLGRVGGRMYFRHDQELPRHGQFLRL
ncbi:hypothetical protein BGZ51_005794 [Haplosporangium sp. Z 767]|nr:hypothetical protein BGZ51_005794 [Haplosporangium sp. Z 767]KAF9183514.1 hypothetical protein BGZ50_004164 [Haplosporangium sp. Z 11]